MPPMRCCVQPPGYSKAGRSIQQRTVIANLSCAEGRGMKMGMLGRRAIAIHACKGCMLNDLPEQMLGIPPMMASPRSYQSPHSHAVCATYLETPSSDIVTSQTQSCDSTFCPDGSHVKGWCRQLDMHLSSSCLIMSLIRCERRARRSRRYGFPCPRCTTRRDRARVTATVPAS